MVQAIVFTQGIVLDNTYFALEMAYRDMVGLSSHCLIRSPVSLSFIRKYYPNSIPEIKVSTDEGLPYSEIVQLLKDRFTRMEELFGTPPVFGFVNLCNQKKILSDACIPTTFNIGLLGVGPTVCTDNVTCEWHENKSICAYNVVNKLWNDLFRTYN